MTDIIESEETPKYAYDGMSAVKFALNGKPVEFQDMINAGLAARLENAVEVKRQEVAGSTFGSPTEPEAPVEGETEEAPVEGEETPEETPAEEEEVNGE